VVPRRGDARCCVAARTPDASMVRMGSVVRRRGLTGVLWWTEDRPAAASIRPRWSKLPHLDFISGATCTGWPTASGLSIRVLRICVGTSAPDDLRPDHIRRDQVLPGASGHVRVGALQPDGR
jgi:hypothetical protein